MSAPSADAIKAKLSAIDASQETIVSIAQWVMFYKRNAAQIVAIWHQCVRDASSMRKLNLIYLANEVAQTSRAKKRPEYPDAFSKVMPEALEHVYRQATTSIQEKLKRVVDVWRQRSVFQPAVIDDMTRRLQGKRQAAQPMIKESATNMPTELEGLAKVLSRVTSAQSASSVSATTAKHIFDSLMNQEGAPPEADVLSQKLTQLTNALEAAQSAMRSVLDIRTEVNQAIQSLSAENQQNIEESQSLLGDLTAKLAIAVERRDRAQQEAAVMQQARSTTPDMEPPQAEALTPPEEGFDLDTVMSQIANAAKPKDSYTANDPVSNMELDESVLELFSKGTTSTAGQEPMEAYAQDEYVP